MPWLPRGQYEHEGALFAWIAVLLWSITWFTLWQLGIFVAVVTYSSDPIRFGGGHNMAGGDSFALPATSLPEKAVATGSSCLEIFAQEHRLPLLEDR